MTAERSHSAELAISSLYNRFASLEERLTLLAQDGRIKYVMHHDRMHADEPLSQQEIVDFGKLIKQHNLVVRDVHGSHGGNKSAWSSDPEARMTGIAVVKSFVDAAHEWAGISGSSEAIVTLHPPVEPKDAAQTEEFYSTLHASFDELVPYAEAKNVVLSGENFFENFYEPGPPGRSNFPVLHNMFERYGDRIGFTFDPGHHNISGDDWLVVERLKAYIDSLHLNDNSGSISEKPSLDDQHRLLYSGSVDSQKVAEYIGTSVYSGPLSMEIGIRNHPNMQPQEFLNKAYETGMRFAKEVEVFKSGT